MHIVSNHPVNESRLAMDTEQIPFAIGDPGAVIGTSPQGRTATQQWVFEGWLRVHVAEQVGFSPRFLSVDSSRNRFEQRDTDKRNAIRYRPETVV